MAHLLTPADVSGRSQSDQVFERELYPLIDAVYSFAMRLSADSTRAEDLVQETYLRAWRFRDRYDAGTNAKAWLFRICQNVFINEYRTLVRTPRKVDYEDIVVYHNEDDPAAPRHYGLQEEIGQDLMGDEVTRAIQSLPDIFRVVVLLDLEDFTYEEIAALADIKLGTVRSRLHRARGLMAKQLRAYARSRGYGEQEGDQPTDTAASAEGNPGEAAVPASCTSA
jgi:RNA polymerase sigma factor (sigma-70 family)